MTQLQLIARTTLDLTLLNQRFSLSVLVRSLLSPGTNERLAVNRLMTGDFGSSG